MQKIFFLLLFCTVLSTYGNAQIKVSLNLPTPCTNTSIANQSQVKQNINLVLSPNPSDGIFSVKLTSSKTINKTLIQVTDIKGNLVFSEEIFCTSSSCIKKMDLSNLTTGVYVLSANGSYFNKQQKFIIKK